MSETPGGIGMMELTLRWNFSAPLSRVGRRGRFGDAPNALVRLVRELFRLKAGLRVKLHFEAYPRLRFQPLRIDSLVLVGCPGVRRSTG